MATYAIGDIQGCADELFALLETIQFDPLHDTINLLGDLVNRGPDSLRVLRWAFAQRDSVFCVLGNHDLHLIARHAGVSEGKRGDTLDAVLQAPDADQLVGWLIGQPLVRAAHGAIFVHAGLLPQWSVAQALDLSAQVQAALNGPYRQDFLERMYGNKPDAWQDKLKGADRIRLIINACTRMRFLDGDRLELKFKGELNKAPPNLQPWFAHPQRHSREARIFCGHWSALGLRVSEQLVALDTGCVWGGALSAFRLEDGSLFQQASFQTIPDNWND